MAVQKNNPGSRSGGFLENKLKNKQDSDAEILSDVSMNLQ